MAKGSQAEGAPNDEEMREFLLVVRRALLVVVRWIERKYRLKRDEE